MSGKIELITIVIILFSSYCLVTDLLKGKIYNHATFPVMLLGIVYSVYLSGFSGLTDAALGILVALLLFGWMFLFGFMGAGDVKMLMALGALSGVQYVFSVALLSILLGGLMAVCVLFWKGSLRNFVYRVYASFLSLIVKEMTLELPELDKKITMPFGIPIAIAAVWVHLQDPFYEWGIFL